MKLSGNITAASHEKQLWKLCALQEKLSLKTKKEEEQPGQRLLLDEQVLENQLDRLIRWQIKKWSVEVLD
jgi:hypothetical protein